ncbi:hypothetical protein DL769_010107 [Monosporascus sp. CRB-8-3]|nr:hypothetical protein DL769_010107 [Monosporascus sp. CRB-8-3]
MDPLRLFKEFIWAAASIEITPRPEYLVPLQTLCEKAPVVARFLAEDIPRHLQEAGGEADLEARVTNLASTITKKDSSALVLPSADTFAAGIHGKNGDVGTTSGHGGLAVQARFAQLAGHSPAHPTTAPGDGSITAEITPTRLMDLDEPNDLVTRRFTVRAGTATVKARGPSVDTRGPNRPTRIAITSDWRGLENEWTSRLETFNLRNTLGEMIDIVAELRNKGGKLRKRRKLGLGSAGKNLSTGHSANISKEVTLRRRRRIIERAGEGRKLRTIILKAGLGILERKIW